MYMVAYYHAVEGTSPVFTRQVDCYINSAPWEPLIHISPTTPPVFQSLRDYLVYLFV